MSAAEAKRYLDRHMTRAARRAYKRNQVASLLGDGEMALAFSGDAGFRERPTLEPGGVSAADIDEMDGVRWARQRANLRSGPSTEHPVAGALAAGEEVAVKGRVRDSEWLLVTTSEGGEAFVRAAVGRSSTVGVRAGSADAGTGARHGNGGDFLGVCEGWRRGRLQGVLGTVPRRHIRAAVRPRSEDERRRFD